MKLTYFQLEPHLAKKLSSIYIISGDEILLKQDAVILIRKAAKQAGFTERMRFTIETGFDWGELYSLLYATSLLAEKQFIELDFGEATPNKNAGKILEEYVKNPSPNNLLLIESAKIDTKTTKSTWYQALEKAGISLPIWPISHEQLPQWICNRAKKYKLQINLDIASKLADYVEGNLSAAAQAIEKIYLLKPQTITEELINTILINESRFSIFDFVEHLIAGNQSRTLTILENLKAEGTEPVLVLWGITRELRLLADYAQQLKQGHTYEEIFQKKPYFFSPADCCAPVFNEIYGRKLLALFNSSSRH